MITPYDEYPVHQSPYPFSYVPSTDIGWTDGYFFGIFNPDAKLFLAIGMRINPNTDMIGGYAMLNIDGRQTTFRFSRCWRRDFSLSVGPFRMDVVEPLRVLRLVLDDNDSGIAFDLRFEGTMEPFLEDHHRSVNRMRRTSDYSRYSQPGQASGAIHFRGQRWDVTHDGGWFAGRDRSWGLYFATAPLTPERGSLPPREAQGRRRALRFWNYFRTDAYSGFFHVHEDENGEQGDLDGDFGTPFGGAIGHGWNDHVQLRAMRHDMTFAPGTRLLKAALVHLTDEQDRVWRMEFDVACPPWYGSTIGYMPGSWRDGGTVHTYHGSEELATEWDEFDFSDQPLSYPIHSGKQDAEGQPVVRMSKPEAGIEYLARVKLHAPDGSVSQGAAHIEHWITGRYAPYGME